MDEQARRMHQSAIEAYVRGKSAAESEKTLTVALQRCGQANCSAELVAVLHRDLGVLSILDGTHHDQGIHEWIEALLLVPTLELDPPLRTEELANYFNDVRKALAEELKNSETPKAPETAPSPTDPPSTPPKEGTPSRCTTDADCETGRCHTGACVDEPRRRLWIGVGISQDIALISSTTNACRLGNDLSATSGYYCTQGGVDYPERTAEANQAIRPDELDKVHGGMALGNVRAFVSGDYALAANVLGGVRLGFVWGTYPGQAAKKDGRAVVPVHLEVRTTYLFGTNPLGRDLVPFAFVGGGWASYSAPVNLAVFDNSKSPPQQTVTAWAVSGPWFATLGFGMRVQLNARAVLSIAPLKANMALGRGLFLPVFSPELGAQIGF